MNHLKKIGAAVLSALALLALTAGSASATTLEVGGATQNNSVTLEITMAAGTSSIVKTTASTFVETCTSSTLKGSTEGPYSGKTIGGKASSWVTGSCTHEVQVVQAGGISIEHTTGTNGTVRSSGVEVEVESTTFGVNLSCTTSNTHLGTLTGTASGHATLSVNAVVNCGFFMPTVNWESQYTVTSPTGLGVVA